MRSNDDDKTVAAMDVLFPKIGEIVGGSQREERLNVLEDKIRENGLRPETTGGIWNSESTVLFHMQATG